MKKLSMKKTILWTMTLILCVTACATAFASAGDCTLKHYSSTDTTNQGGINNVYKISSGFCADVWESGGSALLRFTDYQSEPEKYKLQETAEEDGQPEETCGYFSWNDDLYALTAQWEDSEEGGSISSLAVKHVRLDNGQAVLEDSGLPELDCAMLMEDIGDVGGFYPQKLFTSGDRLAGITYGMNGSIVFSFDLKTGDYKCLEIGEFSEIGPGPEGSVLVNKADWTTKEAVIIRVSLEDQSEEQVAVITDVINYLNPCYDAEKNILYYTDDGELWALPLDGTSQAEVVNDCPINGSGAICLPDGFLLLWDYSTILLRNTDPAQRAGVTLRIRDTSYNGVMSETVFAMNNKRGDIAVIVQPDWDQIHTDIPKAMLNQEADMDIYVLQYESNDFRAIRTRGYTADLSGNAQIAAGIDRMYPYIRDVLKQDGQIIAVPVDVSGQTVGINPDLWKKAGGTGEELPKTWGQFFDWIETLPDKLAGQEGICVCDSAREDFISSVTITILYEYQAWMDGKGENYLFNSPVMNELLTRLKNLDYDALGMKDRDSYEDGYMVGEYKEPLLNIYTDPGLMNFYQPMLLGFAEDETPVQPVQLCVAFVNPYSEHKEEAAEFLALAMDSVYSRTQYSIFADKTEPVRTVYHEENLKRERERLEVTEEALEKAEDGEQRAALEQELNDCKEFLRYLEEDDWAVSPKAIEDYQKRLPSLKVLDYLFLYDVAGNLDEEEQATIENRFSGGTDSGELLDWIDQKVQMIRMEGN